MKRGGADSIGVGALISGRGGDVPTRCVVSGDLSSRPPFESKAWRYMLLCRSAESSGSLQQYHLLKTFAVFSQFMSIRTNAECCIYKAM